jgi:hypothetical protein
VDVGRMREAIEEEGYRVEAAQTLGG